MNRLRNFSSGVVGSVGRILPIMFAFLVGLIWAYNIAPIQFYDAHPGQLTQSWQDNWVTLINDRYVSGSGDSTQLQQLLQAVDAPDEIAERLRLAPGLVELAKQAAPEAAQAPARGSLMGDLGDMAFQLVLFGAIVLLIQFGRGPVVSQMLRGNALSARLGWLRLPRLRLPFLRLPRLRLPFRRGGAALQSVSSIPAEAAAMPPGDARWQRASRRAAVGPLLRQETRYIIGMGEYDESFAIEDEYDNFLGECGAAVTETIGVNDPKAAAIEIWLFDKEDFVRTLTHVFATQHAINDPAIRQRLEPKVAEGALLLAQDGATTVLESRALRLEARITELAYGRDDLPPNSHFAQLGLELQVYSKGETGIASHSPIASPEPLAPAPLAEGGRGSYSDPFEGTGDFSPVG